MTRFEQIIRSALPAPQYFIALVCGGRDYTDEATFDFLMDGFRDELSATQPDWKLVIVHGGARGADRLADLWAKSRGVPAIPCPADWDKHGKAAGVIRNAEMLKRWKPHVVIAFPGGRGTAHMMSIASKAGVLVHEVRV